MKKTIVIILLLISTVSFGQTRYGRRAGTVAGRPMGGYHKARGPKHSGVHHGKHAHNVHTHFRRRG